METRGRESAQSDAHLVRADKLDTPGNTLGPKVGLETGEKPRVMEGNKMSTLAGIYLYGIACILCGVAIGIWLEGNK